MTAPSIKEALEPCPFCNGTDLDFCRNKDGWKIVQCMDCGACGPCIELDDDKSKGRWNTRATLSPPAGERREAIARIIDPVAFSVTPQMYGADKEEHLENHVFVGGARKVARAKADLILASGFVQGKSK